MKRIFIIVSLLAVLGLCSCTQSVGVGLGEADTPGEQTIEETQTNESTADVAPTEETTINEPIVETPSEVEVVETPIDETPAVEEEPEVTEPEVIIPEEPEVVLSTEHEWNYVLGIPTDCKYCGVWYIDLRRINQPCIEH